MGKNDNKNKTYQGPNVTTGEEVKTDLVETNENIDNTVNTEALTQGPIDEIQEPIDDVNEEKDIQPSLPLEGTDEENNDTVVDTQNVDTNNIQVQEETKDSEEDVKDKELENVEIPKEVVEEIKEEVNTKNYTFSLTEAIEFSKDNSTSILLDKLLAEGHLDIKMFAAELTGVINAYNKKSELESNNGNRKLYNLLLRTLKSENTTEFKFKFDVINRTFLEDVNFNPVTLLNCTLWTKSEKDLATFAQLATIIEDLADRATRNENKKRIANLSNLGLDEKSLENIKNYYKL